MDTHEGRDVRLIRDVLVVISKCVMRKYDANQIGRFDVKHAGTSNRFRIVVEWGKFWLKYKQKLEKQKVK